MFERPSQGIYWIVFGVLLLLLGVTAVAGRIDLGIGNLVLAMAMSVAKTLLIAIFFMHLKYAVPTVRIVAGAALLWLAISLALTMADYATRGEGDSVRRTPVSQRQSQ